MPSFSRHDIDTMASRAVDAFNSGSTLHDSVVKLASENSMNPEQIKRLVESANTSAFLEQFNSKTGSDRMVEFKVADPSKVIEESLGSDSSNSTSQKITITISADPSVDLSEDIKNEFTSTPETKVASYQESNGGFFLTSDKEYSLNQHSKHQAKESLLTKIASCNYYAQDLADELHIDFRGIYNSKKYASFELDALSIHGNKAIPGLQMVRSRLGMPKLARSLSDGERFFLADRHVVDTSNSDALTKISKVVDITESLTSYETSLTYLNKSR